MEDEVSRVMRERAQEQKDANDIAAGWKAAEEFVSASGRVRGLILDGRMARNDVHQVRVAARRAFGVATKALERPASDTEVNVLAGTVVDALRKELKALSRKLVADGTKPKSPAEGLAERAIGSARLEQTIRVAEILLPKEDYDLLIDTLGLRSFVV